MITGFSVTFVETEWNLVDRNIPRQHIENLTKVPEAIKTSKDAAAAVVDIVTKPASNSVEDSGDIDILEKSFQLHKKLPNFKRKVGLGDYP